MLEIKKLTKTYITKKGVSTKALDGVSLTFPETGLIFVLGKSGSGKSTLLNVCGGLDKPDFGEIIIKGKSSNDFSGSDFDSYRNTYVGFIFQEYNILNELTIGENIALALELQNKKCDRATVDAILEKVEMREFASRKPNTLSGGQKQRIAIARALVKDPQIIMADEPTGALDSVTGQKVFDILKNLSKEKLVLVISHDRDFAEQYADRIIELKDGRVISDQVKNTQEGEGNVSFFGTDTVCVKNGTQLSEQDFANIKQFIRRSGGSTVITTSREHIASFKQDRPEINAGSFDEIKAQPVSAKYAPQHLIRSHLPLRHAVRMGASGLKTKPVRLVFTILLSVIAFVLFGLASTLMLFDGKAVKVQTFVDMKAEYIALGKQYYVTTTYGDESYEYTQNTELTDGDYEKIAKDYPGALRAVQFNQRPSNVTIGNKASLFYSESVMSVVSVNASTPVKILAGRLPQGLDEVAVTDFLVDSYKSSGSSITYDSNKKLVINSFSDVIWSDSKQVTLKFGENFDLKIVGVIKGMTVPENFKSLKSAADSGELSDSGFSSFVWSQEVESGMYSTLAVSPELFKKVKDMGVSSGGGEDFLAKIFKYSRKSLELTPIQNAEGSYFQCSRMAPYSSAIPLTGLNGSDVTSIGDDEVAINIFQLANIYNNIYINLEEASRDIIYNKFKQEVTDEQFNNSYPFYLLQNLYEFEVSRAQELITQATELFAEIEYKPSLWARNETEPYKIAGYFLGNTWEGIVLSETTFDKVYVPDSSGFTEGTNYQKPAGAYISCIYVPYDGTASTMEKLLALCGKREADDSKLAIRSAVCNILDQITDTAETLTTGFMTAGLIFALFAFLLTFNFISTSITVKKKDIGILRAIGARVLDVFKIFVSEALIIMIVCVILSSGCAYALCSLLNTVIVEDIGLAASLFVFGPLSVLSIFGIALITALISTFIPVGIYSRKPPIESIRAL